MSDNRTPDQRRKNMQAVRTKHTAPEVRVRSLIHRLGFRFRLHRKDLPGTPDLVFPSRKCVLFVHGCYWHGHGCARGRLPASNVEFWRAKISGNIERDSRTVERLRKKGWHVRTVWECETKDSIRLGRSLTRFLIGTSKKQQRKAHC